jgi:hypothetical protein
VGESAERSLHLGDMGILNLEYRVHDLEPS